MKKNYTTHDVMKKGLTLMITILVVASSLVSASNIQRNGGRSPATDTIPPEWRNLGEDKSMIRPGERVSLFCQGKDNVALNWAWLSTDESGSWQAQRSWWNYNWKNSKEVLIDHTKVSADLVNFPVLLTITSSEFISRAQPDGDDFVFIDTTNTVKFNHEIESYNSTTGTLIVWVNVPLLSSLHDTILYLYYGNPSCGSQQNVTGTWNSGYVMVHHLSGTSSLQLKDSTTNHWDVTSVGGSPIYNQPGKIGKCVDFYMADGGDYLKIGGFRLPADSSYTTSAWVYVEGAQSTNRYILEGDTDGGGSMALRVYTNELFRGNAKLASGSVYVYSLSAVPLGSWTYVTLRNDAVHKQLNLSFNGIQEANKSYSSTTIAENNGLNIGAKYDESNYMYGRIDDVCVSNVARSDAWIATEFNNINSLSTFFTVSNRSPMKMQENTQWQWSNFTWCNLSVPPSTTIHWRMYYNDTSGNTVASDIKSFTIVEQPPYEPSTPHPESGAYGIPVSGSFLNWTGGDPDGDPVTYDVAFGITRTPPNVSLNQRETRYNLSLLSFNTTYYWQIVAHDSYGGSTKGHLWNFTTIRDTTPPITAIAFYGTKGNDSWYVSSVDVTLTAVDSQSGVDYTMYKIDGGWTTYTGPFTVSDDGQHNISYYSVDKIGNSETPKTTHLKIDTTAPTVNLTATHIILYQWKFSANVSDLTSGVNRVVFYIDNITLGTVVAPGPYLWEYNGKGNATRVVVYDNAGNSKTSPSVKSSSDSQDTSRVLFPNLRMLLQRLLGWIQGWSHHPFSFFHSSLTF